MPFALIARYHVIPGNAALVEATLREMDERVRTGEPACLAYQVNVDPDNENMFCLYELYATAADVTAHRETPHFRDLIEGIIVPVLERRERELYRQVIS